MGNGLLALADPAARTAFELPVRFAIYLYEAVLP